MRKPQETDHEENISVEKQDAPKTTEVIDTVRTDEALKVITAYDGDTTWDPAEEKRLVRKIDRKLMTILCITYGLQQYDKTMLSQAVSFSFMLSCCIKLATKTNSNMSAGHFRASNRPRPQGWKPLLVLRFHLLSGLHRGCLPCHIHGSAVAH